MRIVWCLCLVAITTVSRKNAIAIDNGVIGEPMISCEADTVSIWVETRNKFRGKIYVKGEYGNRECTRDFNDSFNAFENTFPSSDSTCAPCPRCENGADHYQYTTQYPREFTTFYIRKKRQQPDMAHLKIRLGTCNVRRDRSLSPPGMFVSFTVVVSFHKHFVTKVDRAYQIQCAYMESEKTVASQIDVSMAPTTELVGTAQMPICEYTIRRGSSTGPAIKYANVGDMVFHRWNCNSEMKELFAMLVHDCYVEDGQGQEEQIIDDKGCSVDPFVIPNLVYETDLLASVKSSVFKFADRAILDFQCAITICMKHDGGCRDILPPICDTIAGRHRRRTPNFDTNSTSFEDSKQWFLHAQRLTVIDLDDGIDSKELEKLEDGQLDWKRPVEERLRNGREEEEEHLILNEYRKWIGPQVCLSIIGFGALVATSTFVLTVAAVVFGSFYLFGKPTKISSSSSFLSRRTRSDNFY